MYPAEEKRFFQTLILHRRAYNLAIESLKNKATESQTEVRARIRDVVRKEFEESEFCFVSVVADEAVNSAYRTLQSCVKKWKKGEAAELRFKSAKEPEQYFTVQRLSRSGIFPRILGSVRWTESIPEEAFDAMCKITRKDGRWFACVKKIATTRGRESQAHSRVAAIDPGVRTFATVFSGSHAVKYGDGFSVKVLIPLLHRRDRILSQRQLLVNAKTDKQWWRDQMTCVGRRLDKVAARIDDVVADLHRRVAYDLAIHYDVICLPTSSPKKMTCRKDRKIRKRTVREMLTLRYHEFRLTLQWMCRKYGKILLEGSEAYTSKTRSWDGTVTNIVSQSVLSDGSILVDRDINGARGILLRALTRQLTPLSGPLRYAWDGIK